MQNDQPLAASFDDEQEILDQWGLQNGTTAAQVVPKRGEPNEPGSSSEYTDGFIVQVSKKRTKPKLITGRAVTPIVSSDAAKATQQRSRNLNNSSQEMQSTSSKMLRNGQENQYSQSVIPVVDAEPIT